MPPMQSHQKDVSFELRYLRPATRNNVLFQMHKRLPAPRLGDYLKYRQPCPIRGALALNATNPVLPQSC